MKYSKIIAQIPENSLENMMLEINKSMTSLNEKYDFSFTYSQVIGVWRPLKNAKPFLGQINEIERNEEIKLEITVRETEIKQILKIIKNHHPYDTILCICVMHW